MTTDEVRSLLISCLPQGSEQLYDLRSTANIGRLMTALAGGWRAYGTDLLDTLRREVSPLTVEQKIPEWESALGLANTPIAKFGTITQRRNAILSWLRQPGTFDLDAIRAVVQPYFLYADPNNIQIIEPDRAAQETAHTYPGVPLGVPAGATDSAPAVVLDEPRVAGTVILKLTWATTRDEGTFVSLISPGGNVYAWDFTDFGLGAIGGTQTLRAKESGYSPINGTWTLRVTAGLAVVTVLAWSVFVEGVGAYTYPDDLGNPKRGEGLGAAMFSFVVVADEGFLGTGFDVDGARVALRRMKPAHVTCEVAWSSIALHPECAIPDTRSAIPDRAIPCS